MNKNDYKTFISFLEKEDKDQALLFILGLLEKGEKLQEVYEKLVIPSLLYFECPDKDEEICVWREHTRTSIIRTILESSYKYIISARSKIIDKKVMVVCPQEEYHEIGAIIANHYFSLVGFKSAYIGANTPNEDIISAARALNPDFIAISVTNYYNLIVTKRLTQAIREDFPDMKIILGGQAFKNEKSLEQVDYDYLLSSFEDIEAFKNEVIK